MRELLFLCSSILLSGFGPSGDKFHPYALIIDSSRNGLHPERGRELYRVLAEFVPETQVPDSTVEPSSVTKGTVTEHIKARFPEFKFVSGVAHFSGPTGPSQGCRVFTCPDHDSFLEHVNAYVSRINRPDKSVIGSDRRFTITVPPFTSEGVSYTHTGLNYYYEDGVVATGGEAVDAVDLPAAADWLVGAEDADWQMLVKPKYASSAAKQRFLDYYTAPWNVQMQQRDGELTAQHALRKAQYSVYADSLTNMVDDIEDFKWTIKFPQDDRPYTSEIDVQIRPDSGLAKLVRELRPARRKEFARRSSDFAAGFINVNLPESIQSGLDSAIANSSVGSSRLGAILQQTVKSGRLDARLGIGCDPDGRPVLNADMWVDAIEMRADELAASLGGTVIDDVNVTIPVSGTLCREPVDDIRLITAVANNRMHLHVHQQDPEHEQNTGVISQADDQTDGNSVKSKAINENTVFHLEMDLSNIPNGKDNIQLAEIVRKLERVYQTSTILESDDEELHFLLNKGMISIPQPVSVVDRLAPEGDWTLKCTVNISRSGDVVQFRMRAGRELYGLYWARKWYTQKAIEKMLP